MHVVPISAHDADKQASEFGLWPPGDYDFEVYDASEETSSTGNEMIKVTLHVFNPEGKRRTVFDYLVSAQNAAYKVRHFAEAVGLVTQYERGIMSPNEMVQRVGRCRLRIKKGTGNYQDQNAVADYIKAANSSASQAPAATRAKTPAGDIDDDIPF
jgi:hypothetical protein